MNLQYLLGVAAASLALSSVLSQPAAAHDKDPFATLEEISPGVLFKGLIREDDVSLLFQHLRESMAASARGEEAVPSAAMNQRAEVIQREVAARGGVLMGVFLSAFESAAKQMVREGLGELRPSPAFLPPRIAPYPRSGTHD